MDLAMHHDLDPEDVAEAVELLLMGGDLVRPARLNIQIRSTFWVGSLWGERASRIGRSV
jgi:hypothetical protein